MAKCGNIEGDQCEHALNDADAAKADVDNVKAGIDEVAGKITKGENLSTGEQKFVEAIGAKFGDRFTSEKGLNRLSEGLSKISNKIGARGEGMTLNTGNNKGDATAYVVSVAGFFSNNSVHLNSAYYTSSSQYRQMVMVHEAGHLSRFMGYVYIKNGVNPLYNRPKAWSNADTYACAVYPASCGY